MEAPLPATPKYDEDNLQKPLSNEEKNNNKINEKNSNEENNIKINFDKEKVAKLRESFGKEIESLAKTYSNFMTKFEATFGAMQEIGSNYINHQ